MDRADIELRNATYRRFADLGRAPSAGEVGEAVGRSEGDVRAGWRRLHDAHALVLDEGDRIRMANPFSAVPSAYRVRAAGRDWYANCAWDALGIGAALHADSSIDTACPDCREPIRLDMRDGRPSTSDPVFHVLVPAASWWDDIGYT